MLRVATEPMTSNPLYVGLTPQVYPDKYCQLVEQENGIQILNELIDHKSPYCEIKRIARMVIEQCDMGMERMVEG